MHVYGVTDVKMYYASADISLCVVAVLAMVHESTVKML